MMECSLKEGREEGILQGMQRGMQKGILKGRREGIQQGEKESMNKIARNLLKMNFSAVDIAKATGLTLEQIKQL
jgi:predicted transposase/invertase (TIGR01784 family)